MKPTPELAESLQTIFQGLNDRLFDGELPECMVTLSRNQKITGGYFSPAQWENDEGQKVPEIGINANVLAIGDHVHILNILTHEMIHLWQDAHGKPGRPGYHNKEFAQKCDELGLEIICHDRDAKEGQTTGQNIETRMKSGEAAELVVAQIAADSTYDLAWWSIKEIIVDEQGNPQPAEPNPSENPPTGGEPSETQKEQKPAPKRSGSRTKYTCATCGLNAWAKHGVSLICGDCNRPMVAMV